MFKHLPVAHFHDATFLTKHIEVYRRAVVTEQIGVFVRVMTGFGVTVNLGMGAMPSKGSTSMAWFFAGDVYPAP